jgi:hypothetical protein
VNLFNSFSTQKIETEIPGPFPMADQSRVTRLDHILQLTYGLTRSRRFNAGLDVYYSHSRIDGDENSSPWRVFGSDALTGYSYHLLSGIGFRVRAMPIRTLPELSLQSTVIFPTAGNPENKQATGRDRIQWLAQANFYQQFRPWLYVFLTLDASIQFENEDRRQTTYSLPLGLYAVAEVVRGKVYVYPGIQYLPNYEKTFKGPLKRISYQLLYGLGAQYYPSPKLALILQLQRPIDLDIGSLRSEVVRGSYSIVTLGGRLVVGGR